MSFDKPGSQGRETFVSIFLALLLAGVFFFFLFLIFSGIFGGLPYLLLPIVGFVAFGFLHYVFWGYAFSREVAGEREEEEFRSRLETQERDDRY